MNRQEMRITVDAAMRARDVSRPRPARADGEATTTETETRTETRRETRPETRREARPETRTGPAPGPSAKEARRERRRLGKRGTAATAPDGAAPGDRARPRGVPDGRVRAAEDRAKRRNPET